jgi:hypothetical protein
MLSRNSGEDFFEVCGAGLETAVCLVVVQLTQKVAIANIMTEMYRNFWIFD